MRTIPCRSMDFVDEFGRCAVMLLLLLSLVTLSPQALRTVGLSTEEADCAEVAVAPVLMRNLHSLEEEEITIFENCSYTVCRICCRVVAGFLRRLPMLET